MILGNTAIDDYDCAYSHIRQVLDDGVDGLGAELGLVCVHRDHVKEVPIFNGPESLKHQAGFSEAGQSDHAGNAARLHHALAHEGAQAGETFIFDPGGAFVLRAAGPVRPGAEGTDGSTPSQILYPYGDGRMVIHPCGDLVGVMKGNPLISNVHAGVAKGLTDRGFPFPDLLLDVRMGTEQDVVATGLKDRTHHVLDRARLGQDLTARCGRRYLPCLQLELAEPGWKEWRAFGAACPGDAPVLAPIRSRHIACHMDAVGRDTVGMGLGIQQPSQERRKRPLVQNRNMFTRHVERAIPFGSVHGSRRASLQGSHCTRIGLQQPEQVDDRRRGLHGTGLVLGKGARPAAQQFTGLYLGQAKLLPNGADLVGGDFRVYFCHFSDLYGLFIRICTIMVYHMQKE